MADQTSTLRINAEVEGTPSVKELTAAYQQMSVGIANFSSLLARVRPPTAVAEPKNIGQKIISGAGDLGMNALKGAANVAGGAIKTAASSLLSFAGPLSNLAMASLTTAPTAIAAGVALVTVVPFVFNLGVTYTLMRRSWRWAQESMRKQFDVAYRTRTTFPGIIEEEFNRITPYVKARMGIATAIFGEAASSMEEMITRRLTPERLMRGIRGERDLFSAVGITPGFIQQMERMKGQELNVGGRARLDLTDYLGIFIKKREALDAQIMASPEGSAMRRILAQRKGKFLDSSLKIFSAKFADVASFMTSDDLQKLADSQRASTSLNTVTKESLKNSTEFRFAMQTTTEIFHQLKMGIGREVQPVITRILTDLNDWLLPIREDGKSMAMNLRNLGASLATKGWELMEALLRRIRPDTVKRLGDRLKRWKPEGSIKILMWLGRELEYLAEGLVRALVAGAKAVSTTAKVAGEIVGHPLRSARPSRWVSGGPAGAAYRAAAYGAPVVGPATPRLGGGGMVSGGALPGAPAGGGGYPGGGGGGGVAGRGRSGSGYLQGNQSSGYTGPSAAPGGPAGALPEGVSSNVLAGAAQAALANGYQGAADFIYKNTGKRPPEQWCGAFAEAVVRKHGLTPPKDPWVAASWRNWGEAVQGAPQAGDIVVVSGKSRFTQQEGRHVTFVEKYDPKTDRVLTVGGNEGYERGKRRWRKRSELYIRRVPTQVAGQPGARPIVGDETQEPPPAARPSAFGPVPKVSPEGQITGYHEPIQPRTEPRAAPTTTGQAYGVSGRLGSQTPEVKQALTELEAKHGIHPDAIRGLVHTESKWNPRAQTRAGRAVTSGGTYRGLFQMGEAWHGVENLSPADQIRTYSKWLDSYQFNNQLKKYGVDFQKLTPAQQAAYLQGFQFAPSPQATGGSAIARLSRGGRATGSQQARVLGTTTLREMETYYSGLLGKPASAPEVQQAVVRAVEEGTQVPQQAVLREPLEPQQPPVRQPTQVWPTTGTVGSQVGMRRHPVTGQWKQHEGIDISGGNQGQPVVSTGGGTVIKSGWAGGYGNFVEIKRKDGSTERYAHMLVPSHLKVGQSVGMGERVGNVGATGRVTGPHLHYERRDAKGNAININEEFMGRGTKIVAGQGMGMPPTPTPVQAPAGQPTPLTPTTVTATIPVGYTQNDLYKGLAEATGLSPDVAQQLASTPEGHAKLAKYMRDKKENEEREAIQAVKAVQDNKPNLADLAKPAVWKDREKVSKEEEGKLLSDAVDRYSKEERKKEAAKAREDLTKPAPSKNETEIKEGTAAGEAAVKSFKEGVKDVKIPVKSLTEEEKNRDKKAEEKEQQAEAA